MSHRNACLPDILLVEDDVEFAAELCFGLKLAGFVVHLADCGGTLDQLLAAGTRGVVVLDLTLPGEDGFSIARRLAFRSDLRIVMLTARAGETDRVMGVKAGADAYLTKPVNLDELIAVVRRVAARMSCAPSPLVLDNRRQILTDEHGLTVKLTTLECWFLACVAQAPDRRASRQVVEQALWENDLSMMDKRLDVLVHRIRAKLAAASPDMAELVATQWRHGYSLLRDIRVI